MLDKDNILMSFTLFKIITRCLKLGFKIIFVDESGLMNGNNNYKCLRKKGEEIYFKYLKNEKRNLLLALDDKKTIIFGNKRRKHKRRDFFKFYKRFKSKIR